MTTPDTRKLKFGYNAGVPAQATAAWGARAIINPENTVDIVRDRTGTFGPEGPLARLLTHLDERVGRQWRQRAETLLNAGLMDPATHGEHILYNDGIVIVKGNPQASHGYLYVCAYFDPAAR